VTNMSKHVIDEIRKVEEECKKVVEDAENKKVSSIANSKSKSQALWEVHEEKWKKEKAKKLEADHKKIEQEKKKLQQEGEKQVKKLANISSVKKEKAVRLVLEQFYKRCEKSS